MSESLRVAVGLHQAGRWAEAEAAYRAFLETVPDHPDGVALLGVLCAQTGRAEEAVRLGEKAVRLDPASGLFRFYLGNAYFAAGCDDDAEAAYRASVRLEPRSVDAWYNLGNGLQKKGALAEAETAYAQALALAPRHALARNNLALLFEKRGDLARALEEIQTVVAQNPTFAEGWLNLCNLAEQNGAFDLAEKAGRIGTRLDPTNAALWFGLGVACNRLEKNAEAIAVYRQALALRPDWGEAWDNLAQSYQFENRLAEAEEAYRHRIDLAGQSLPDADVLACDETAIGNHHWHLALLELLKGDLLHGFARYRARFHELGGLQRPAWPKPVWRGEDLRGKTILIYDEQGFGDTLMMARYFPLLKQAGATVWLIAGAPLVPFLKGWSCIDRLFTRNETPDLGFDFFASSFDLPFVFGTTLETIPFAEGYLPGQGDASVSSHDKKRIGLVWAGSPAHKYTARRNVPLESFAPLFARDDVKCVGLTRDQAPGDAETLRRFGIEDLAPHLHDFADTARLVQECDALVTCDTSVAHLAGGLGKRVLILLPFAPDWRWGLGSNRTPWYASAQLIRQDEKRDWATVVRALNVAI